MKKIILFLILLVALASLILTGISFAKCTVANIIIHDELTDLRSIIGMDKMEPVEISVSEKLNRVEDSYISAIWMEVFLIILSAIALIIEFKNNKNSNEIASPNSDTASAESE